MIMGKIYDEYLTDTGRRLVDIFSSKDHTKSIGGYMRTDDYYIYEELRDRWKKHGLSVSYTAFAHAIKLVNEIEKVTFPLATKFGRDPLQFTNDIVDTLILAVTEEDQGYWVEKTEEVYNGMLEENKNSLIDKQVD
jgi:hypothetical protein